MAWMVEKLKRIQQNVRVTLCDSNRVNLESNKELGNYPGKIFESFLVDFEY